MLTSECSQLLGSGGWQVGSMVGSIPTRIPTMTQPPNQACALSQLLVFSWVFQIDLCCVLILLGGLYIRVPAVLHFEADAVGMCCKHTVQETLQVLTQAQTMWSECVTWPGLQQSMASAWCQTWCLLVTPPWHAHYQNTMLSFQPITQLPWPLNRWLMTWQMLMHRKQRAPS